MADTSPKKIRAVVKEFLKDADLSTASSKKVRTVLNEKFDCDFSARKKEIDKIVMEVLSELESAEKDDSESEASDDGSGDDYSEDEKTKKKPAPTKPAAKKAKPAKKKPSKKSESDSESAEEDDDDSEDDRKKKKRSRASNGSAAKARKSGGGGGAKTGRATGYLKKLKLSPELATVMETDLMARNEVVKKMYEVVKARELLDPKNRQFALLDAELQKVFGQKRIRMFGMVKLLNKHFSAAD